MLSDHLLKCPTFEEKLKLSIPPDFSLFFLFCLINLRTAEKLMFNLVGTLLGLIKFA